MVEAQTWATRRMSNPRIMDGSTVSTTSSDQVLDIPATPPGDLRNNAYSTAGSYFSPNILTAGIIASWYLSNIGVLLLNKYLLSYYGYRTIAAYFIKKAVYEDLRFECYLLFLCGNVASITIEKARGDPYIVFLLIGNATVAYLVNLTNFLVTKHTSALTLQVLGNAKAAVAAAVSIMIFRNPVTAMGIAGFAVTIMGVVLYSEAKKRSKVTTH
ncbi:hypothetical protein OIU76_017913 [Salix suchowensis]|nr:hypothetical protein OIU76_017913 [Salix suchowensis]